MEGLVGEVGDDVHRRLLAFVAGMDESVDYGSDRVKPDLRC